MTTVLSFIAGIGLVLLALSLKNYRNFYLPNWVLRAIGETPWAPGLARHMRAVPNGGLQPTHEVYFVNRQDIAECGIACPKCGGEVAERGDFSRIVLSMVDGQRNEVVKCPAMIEVNPGDKPRPCPAWLAASPNTEHGDDLIEGDPPEFYIFNRITQAQALKEKYGMEISAADADLLADPKARPEGSIPSNKDIVEGAFVPFPEAVAAAQEVERAKLDVAAAQESTHPGEADTRILPALPEPPKEP